MVKHGFVLTMKLLKRYAQSPNAQPIIQSSKGFTLIELLVSVAIIATLAAIIFPVFARSREAARRTSCLSNMKQIGLGLLGYIQDYDNVLPESADNDVKRVTWDNKFVGYIDTKKNAVLRCPSAPDNNQRRDYAFHADLFPDNDLRDDRGNLISGGALMNTWPESIITNPSNTMVVIELRQNGQSFSYAAFNTRQENWAEGSILTNGTVDFSKDNSRITIRPDHDKDLAPGQADPIGSGAPRYRHNDTTNALFFDGHAKSFSKGQIKWYQNIFVKEPYAQTAAMRYPTLSPQPY